MHLHWCNDDFVVCYDIEDEGEEMPVI